MSYTVQGKRGYLITSRLEEEEHHDTEAELFRRLSEQFEALHRRLTTGPDGMGGTAKRPAARRAHYRVAGRVGRIAASNSSTRSRSAATSARKRSGSAGGFSGIEEVARDRRCDVAKDDEGIERQRQASTRPSLVFGK